MVTIKSVLKAKILVKFMGKTTDFFLQTLSSTKTWLPVVFPTPFPAPPICIAYTADAKKKSGSRNVTSTGAEISAEASPVRLMLAEDNGHAAAGNAPESESGTHTVTTGKTFEPVPFSASFPVPPIIICGYVGNTAGGKKVSHRNVTNSSFEISNEEDGGTTAWFAICPPGPYSA